MADVAIIGAGPAGLTAAYHLAKHGASVQVLEADEEYVGGISRTVNYKGFRFDIGGHRFFSKSDRVNAMWKELLGDELLERPRSSRILYGGRFYSYPLKPVEALMNLGVAESARCVLSYLKARGFPEKDPKSFEDWVTNQFGSRLFRIFFKTYTEKVWGMSCKEISADWAAQRIKGLSLWSAISSAIMAAVLPKSSAGKGEVIKTLINSFHYPRFGPGMMWERCAERVRQMGGEVLLGHRVGSCRWDSASRTWRIECTAGGETKTVQATHIISSAPMKEFVAALRPAVSGRVLQAAQALRYRDFLTVGLILRDRKVFTDNWIYIHEPSVQVGRVQNYKSWSPDMVPDPAYACYGMEYFCNSGPGLWSTSDEDLIALAKKELEQIGLGRAEDVVDGCVIRQPKAYPVYDDGYAAHVATVRDSLQENFPTLHLVGRNGMHRYNNQDHAMMTALLSAENILADRELYDVWRVNQDAEYHEAGPQGDQQEVGVGRLVPTRTAVAGGTS
ncbi:MAG TPA: NAD(P)/FAD-dependent oxidoreductase [Candidatus Acidoferrales bacterium]|jgi:protoporphyrinogen oxidase|nr:NAD(P)/FAD-dependent oxidoreductase [Candidatus Acidoferrales bacterium]